MSDLSVRLLAALDQRDEAPVSATPAEELARYFHETYEQLAPLYGYKTRTESAVPWDKVPEANRRLMVTVCARVLTHLGLPVFPPTAERIASDAYNLGYQDGFQRGVEEAQS